MFIYSDGSNVRLVQHLTDLDLWYSYISTTHYHIKTLDPPPRSVIFVIQTITFSAVHPVYIMSYGEFKLF